MVVISHQAFYCYGSFGGLSYKKTYYKEKDVPLEQILEAADDIVKLGFKHVHLLGGEPFLRKDIWQIIERLASQGVDVWVLTNGTFIVPGFEQNFARGLITRLCFSLDSIQPSYNNLVRSHTKQVISNIKTVSEMKTRLQLPTELGLYVVLTKKNIDLAPELFDWAEHAGISYINMQTVYLPAGHPYRDELSLTERDHQSVMKLMERLRQLKDRMYTSSEALINLVDNLLLQDDHMRLNQSVINYVDNALDQTRMTVRSCFAGTDFLFISGGGDVLGCPSKPSDANAVSGNIRDERLTSIVNRITKYGTCPHISLDCLGMFEMVFQETSDN